jgi:hypothetical protein
VAKQEVYVFETTVTPATEVTFTLRFNLEDSDSEDHEFTVSLHEDDAGLPLSLSSYFVTDGKGNEGIGLGGIVALLERLMIEGDYARFKELLVRRDLTVSSKQLEQVGDLLIHKMTGRPTPASLRSLPQRRTTGPQSTAKRSTAART